MVLLRRSAVLAILLVGFVGTLTVEARSHHLSRRNTETAEGNANEADDDYAAFGDEAYNNDDVLNDDSQNYDEDDDDRDAEGGENEELEPSILLTKSTNFTIPQRGKVWLPCEVTNAENAVIIWKKDQTILFQNEARFTKNPRIYRYSNFTISITDLESSDLGLYTCSVVGSQGNPSIAAHRVSFPQPPQVVLMLPEGNARLVPEGRPLKVECRVRGDPQPTISWSRKGQRLTKDDVEFGNQFIYIKNVRRQDSGMYQCLASNNVGQPAYGAVDIKVLHVPEVHVKKSVVNTDEGYEAHMLCTVKSEPRATIVWERNGVVLKDSQHHHITLDQNGDHSKLRILSVTPNDFGKYECKANNAYGSGEGHVNLVRHPGRALWISGAQEADSSPVLQWAVESVQPITDAELRYYKVDESKPDRVATEEEWIVVKPDITQPNGNVYTVKHVLQGLRPGKYAARLRSKNTHGWSELSEQHMFDGDYETNEVLNNEILVEAPVAEVGSSAINNKYSSFATAATLLLSMISYSLVRIM